MNKSLQTYMRNFQNVAIQRTLVQFLDVRPLQRGPLTIDNFQKKTFHVRPDGIANATAVSEREKNFELTRVAHTLLSPV
jgi:hypothetical protein